MTDRRRQSGVALLIVLMVVALATLLAADLVRRQQLSLKRSATMLHGDQALIYAFGAEAWAASLLGRQSRDNWAPEGEGDWAVELPPTPVPGGSIAGRLRDLQGRFNLNNLQQGETRDALARDRFARLLAALDLPPQLLPAVVDWIDPDTRVEGNGGAEDDLYSRLAAPYRTANRPLAEISELQLISGVDNEVYARLAGQVTALPGMVAINVNTASVEVLQALGMNRRQAEAVLEARSREAFGKINDFLALDALQGLELEPQRLSVDSRYFELETDVVVSQMHYRQQSILQQDGGAVRVLLRRRRGW